MPSSDENDAESAVRGAGLADDRSCWLSGHSDCRNLHPDTLLDLDSSPHPLNPGPNTLLLKNVYIGNLQASDFVSHGLGNVA